MCMCVQRKWGEATQNLLGKRTVKVTHYSCVWGSISCLDHSAITSTLMANPALCCYP